jgi:hypothetical protein
MDVEFKKFMFYAQYGDQPYSWHSDFQSATSHTKPEVKEMYRTLVKQSGNKEKKLKIIRITVEVQ